MSLASLGLSAGQTIYFDAFATSRVDGFLKGKAVYKDTSMITGYVLLRTAEIAAWSDNDDLAIVAAIVEAHDGEVRLETAPGAGATFTVTLPLLGAQA